MPLFTAITDLMGGSYVSQVVANTPDEAALSIVESLDVSTIEGLELKDLDGLRSAVASDRATPVEQATNVWCVSRSVGDELMLIHLVRTAEAE